MIGAKNPNATEERIVGSKGEDVAAAYLQKKGYKILERNYRAGKQEIDIICSNDDYIIFVEVKTRSSDSFAKASDAVNSKKRTNVVKGATGYFDSLGEDKFPRFDVVEVYFRGDNTEINHIENAFDSNGHIIL